MIAAVRQITLGRGATTTAFQCKDLLGMFAAMFLSDVSGTDQKIFI